MDDSPFHAGEQALQSRCGVRERIEAVGRSMIRDHMPEPHRAFFANLPLLYLATLDRSGQPWPTVIAGPRGFVSTPDAASMRIGALPADDDPAADGLRPDAAVGLLGLEPQSRRRNRMNGVLADVGPEGFTVRVAQSFGNCPKYIQAREPIPRPERRPRAARSEGPQLSEGARALVARADTLFVASSSGAAVRDAGRGGAGVDISHRGGRPGFVHQCRTERGDRLTLPDYAGNRLFNTLGNVLAWPRAGLLFVDWAEGDLLQLAATAEIQHEGAELRAYPGAQRLLHLQVERGWWRPAALPYAWTAAEFAAQFADTAA